MPFQSEAQRKYMWMHHPELARKWAHEYPHQGKLPEHKHNREHVNKSTDHHHGKR